MATTDTTDTMDWQVKNSVKRKLPEVEVEFSLPTDVPLPPPRKSSSAAPEPLSEEEGRAGSSGAGREQGTGATPEFGGKGKGRAISPGSAMDDEEAADRVEVDELLALDASFAVEASSALGAPSAAPAPVAAPASSANSVSGGTPAPSIPLDAPALAPSSSTNPVSTGAPAPQIPHTYTPFIVEAILCAAAPLAVKNTFLHFTLKVSAFPEQERYIIVIPPPDGWCVLTIGQEYDNYVNILLPPQSPQSATAPSEPEVNANASSGQNSNAMYDPDPNDETRGPPVPARVADALPWASFEQYFLPQLAGPNGGLCAVSVALWLSQRRWWPDDWDGFPEGYSPLRVDEALAREEHAALLSGRRVSIDSVSHSKEAAEQLKRERSLEIQRESEERRRREAEAAKRTEEKRKLKAEAKVRREDKLRRRAEAEEARSRGNEETGERRENTEGRDQRKRNTKGKRKQGRHVDTDEETTERPKKGKKGQRKATLDEE